jgi:DNA-directed RNA polymerase subunit omega
MNSELTKKALELVGNPSTLVNLMSRRVRQLTTGGGGMSRPLVEPPVGAGVADIALLEIIEGKITFESTQEGATSDEVAALAEKPAPKRRRKTTAA